MVSVPKPAVKNKKADPLTVDIAINYLSVFHPVNKSCSDYLKKKAFEVKLKKHELLHKSGEICPYVYFVIKGILRGYIIDNKKNITTWITSENQLVSSIRGFLLQQPTAENIEALEDCHLLALLHSDLENAYEQFVEFNIVGRKINEFYYTFAEDRAFICRLSNATDRYNYFMQNHSHLVNRISLSYIASYLGISIETLSRIRSRQSKKKQSLPAQ
ncbi:Crp/Fnr family transcriptional regulator [Pseudobacter ginsenosidimutans]|uniref:CRP-like cAMP-binding protein n=1 Tax=Pseudobacter ginsenosidimutans TaxID=661488 RepID=A0A4Q7MWV4_9BACT|nr:Crp/Fnr family transcriptional regulator [Pseudobacter ginsenosidimutans]QEC41553.1 Crp/Fnr family transcriptional regulator [Pseudobacter ginsenosidimutans]RZS71663.1 CRP-like cAMP-binding protein [Pseudobacter ginsenosidimutans]